MLTGMATSAQTVSKQEIIFGNCLAIMTQLAAASIDVIVTSPPYNIGISYKTYDDNLPREAYLTWLKKVKKHLARVLKVDGSFFLNVGSTNSDPWIALDVAAAFRNKFVLQNHIIWVKSISISDSSFGHFKPIPSRRYLNQNYEHVFHFTKSGAVEVDRLAIGVPFKDKTNITRWGHPVDRRCGGNVWFIPYKTVQTKAQKYNHPTGFPIELPVRCMLLHGKKNLVVLDPFLGTGTTLVAAEKLGHRGIGIEIDAEYVSIAIARLRAEIAAAENQSDNGQPLRVAR